MALIFVQWFYAPSGDIGEATVKRRQGFFIERRPAEVGRATEILQQDARKLRLIVRQLVYERVKGFLVVIGTTLTLLSY